MILRLENLLVERMKIVLFTAGVANFSQSISWDDIGVGIMGALGACAPPPSNNMVDIYLEVCTIPVKQSLCTWQLMFYTVCPLDNFDALAPMDEICQFQLTRKSSMYIETHGHS